MTKGDYRADGSIDSGMTWEQFKVVDAGHGLVALWSPRHDRFVRMPNQKYLAKSDVRTDGVLEDYWTSAKFKAVEVGDGNVAFWNPTRKRFISMRQDTTNLEKSGERPDASLPSHWTWEKFLVVIVTEAPTEAGAELGVGEKLVYWCDDGYVVDQGLCDVGAFEDDMDYWLPDEQNIWAPRSYNQAQEAQFGVGLHWTDKQSNGETFYWGNIATAKACCELCVAEHDCSSFAYNADPAKNYEPWSGAGNLACYLKRGLKPNRRGKSGVISGFPVGSFTVTCNADLTFAETATCVPKASVEPLP